MQDVMLLAHYAAVADELALALSFEIYTRVTHYTLAHNNTFWDVVLVLKIRIGNFKHNDLVVLSYFLNCKTSPSHWLQTFP